MHRVAFLTAACAAILACDTAQQVPAAETALRADGCDRCHGYPPTTSIDGRAIEHPQISDCHRCHPQTVDAGGNIIPGGGHMNGKVDGGGHDAGFAKPEIHGPAALADLASCQDCHGADYAGAEGVPSCNACHAGAGWTTDWRSNCTFCHGTATKGWSNDVLAAAPPRAASFDPADPAIGAHQAHLTEGPLAGAFPCTTCHAIPDAKFPASLAHVKGQGAAFQFSPLAIGTAPAAYDPATHTCTVYCHGPATPDWRLGTSQAECGSCHGVPPANYIHQIPNHTGKPCYECHAGYETWANKALHVNGVVDVVVDDKSGGTTTLTGAWTCQGCHTVNAYHP